MSKNRDLEDQVPHRCASLAPVAAGDHDRIIHRENRVIANYELKLLAEMIDEAHRPTPIRQLPSGRRRKYHGAAVTKTRAKVEADLASGIVPVTRQHIRDALCDAAMHILATDSDGAETIRKVLSDVFRHAPDTPAAIVGKLEAGKIEPRFFKSR